MQTVSFQTSLGTVLVRGLAKGFQTSKPAVLAITGAFAKADYMCRLPEVMEPDHAGFVCHLPGNHGPELNEVSVTAFARAFDEVVDQLNRPVVVLGVSVGALVGLAMKHPAALVAVEPPLSTGELWPMAAGIRPMLEQHPAFFWEIFGFSQMGGAARSYRGLVDALSIPTTVVVGDEPLWPKRPVARYPSFVSDADRAYMAAHPLISLHIAPGAGHDVPMQAAAFLHARVMACCSVAFGNRPNGIF